MADYEKKIAQGSLKILGYRILFLTIRLAAINVLAFMLHMHNVFA